MVESIDTKSMRADHTGQHPINSISTWASAVLYHSDDSTAEDIIEYLFFLETNHILILVFAIYFSPFSDKSHHFCYLWDIPQDSYHAQILVFLYWSLSCINFRYQVWISVGNFQISTTNPLKVKNKHLLTTFLLA